MGNQPQQLHLNHQADQLNEELIYLNQLDILANLYNWEHFLEKAKDKINDLPLDNTSIHIAMIDICLFKQYNDTYGHLKGNKCLKKVADEIKRSVENIEML